MIPNGQLAIYLGIATAGIIPLLNIILQRAGVSLTRRTELDKIASDRIKFVETELRICREEVDSKSVINDELREQIQLLREQHLKDLQQVWESKQATQIINELKETE